MARWQPLGIQRGPRARLADVPRRSGQPEQLGMGTHARWKLWRSLADEAGFNSDPLTADEIKIVMGGL
eukprot:1925112-Amphidinium_carterae.1